MTVDDMVLTLNGIKDVEVVDTGDSSVSFETSQGDEVRTKVVAALNKDNVIQSRLTFDDGVWTVELLRDQY